MEHHERITIQTEEGREVSCKILTIFSVKEKQYIVILPEDGSSDGKGYLFRLYIEQDGSPRLEKIRDDREYQDVSAVFSSGLPQDDERLNDF